MSSDAAPFPVYANGRIHPAGTPVISAEDQGFLLGLAVFDTVLFEDGCLYFIDEHIARLRRGADELGIAWPPPWDPEEAMRATAAALGERDVALRLTLSRGVPGEGPTVVVTPRPTDIPAPEGVTVMISTHRKLGGNQLESVKSTNRLRNILAREEAQAAGAWEALMVDHTDHLTEGTVSNVFAVVDGVLRTPGIDDGCLGGIIREQVLSDLEREPLVVDGAAVAVRVGPLSRAELARASEVFLTNTTGRVTAIREVLGATADPLRLPGGEGAVTRLVRERVRTLEAAYRAARGRQER